jgi:hypothetical protein
MVFQHHKESLTPSAAVYEYAECIPLYCQQRSVPFYSFLQFFKCRNAGLSGTGIKWDANSGARSVPEYSSNELRCRGPECPCRRHVRLCQRACKGPSPVGVGHGPVDKAPGCCKVALGLNPQPSTPKMGSSKLDEQPTVDPTKIRKKQLN